MPSSCWRRQAADVAHPAFSKLFVETEYRADVGAILATRRRRSPDEPKSGRRISRSSMARPSGKPEFETDRARFLGRGRGVRTRDRGDRRPAAVEHGRHGARSGLRPAPARARSRPARPCASPSGRVVAILARGAARPRRQASRHHRLRAGRRRWPGPRRRCSSTTSASIRARRACSSVSRDTSSMPAPTLRPSSDAILRGAGAQSGLWPHEHFRRPADRAAAHRRHREPRHRPPTAAGARILADEAVSPSIS